VALAYFITFSTYGTWLHGTAKGNGSVDRRHNIYGTPFIPPDEGREDLATNRMAGPPYVLEETARTIVRDAIVAYCEEKKWTLLALHVRTNHVHAVVSAECDPGRLVSDLKARASRELNRSGTDGNANRWTRHGSTRHLFDEASVAAAVVYTLDEQGPPMAVYDPRKEPFKEPRTQ
jgi:REP element-mobilizing transposase RayT